VTLSFAPLFTANFIVKSSRLSGKAHPLKAQE